MLQRGVADISRTKIPGVFLMSSTPTNVMILHILVYLFACLLLSWQKLGFSHARMQKRGVADISKTKRLRVVLMSSTPTNVMILHILVYSFAPLLLS